MSIDRDAILAAVRGTLDEPVTPPPADVTVLAHVVAGWLDDVRSGGPGPPVGTLDAVCRQIDVRHRLSATYRSGWKRVDPEIDAPDGAVSGVVAVLLAVADARADRGRDLKLVNSALKALDLRDELPTTPALRAWAVELLDRATVDGAA